MNNKHTTMKFDAIVDHDLYDYNYNNNFLSEQHDIYNIIYIDREFVSVTVAAGGKVVEW